MNTTLSYGIMNFLKQKKINKRKALILDLWTFAHSYLAMIMGEKPRKTQVKVRKKTYQMLEVTEVIDKFSTVLDRHKGISRTPEEMGRIVCKNYHFFILIIAVPMRLNFLLELRCKQNVFCLLSKLQ